VERPYPKTPVILANAGIQISRAAYSKPATEPASPMDSRFRGSDERVERPYPNPVIPANAGIQ